MSEDDENGDEKTPETGQIGSNHVTREHLQSYVERIERLDEEKAAIAEDRKLVKAEAAANGFDTSAITRLVKRRKLKPSELSEIRAIDDLYESALGMKREPDLFSAVGAMQTDIHSREAVINAFSALVPSEGEIIVKVGAPVKLYRVDGEVIVEDYVEETQRSPTTGPSPKATSTTKTVPEVDGDGAEELGSKAFKEDQPITANPFPFGDERRQRFDKGYRKASGGDGMDDDK